jgi:hypothetical protein
MNNLPHSNKFIKISRENIMNLTKDKCRKYLNKLNDNDERVSHVLSVYIEQTGGDDHLYALLKNAYLIEGGGSNKYFPADKKNSGELYKTLSKFSEDKMKFFLRNIYLLSYCKQYDINYSTIEDIDDCKKTINLSNCNNFINAENISLEVHNAGKEQVQCLMKVENEIMVLVFSLKNKFDESIDIGGEIYKKSYFYVLIKASGWDLYISEIVDEDDPKYFKITKNDKEPKEKVNCAILDQFNLSKNDKIIVGVYFNEAKLDEIANNVDNYYNKKATNKKRWGNLANNFN